MKTLRINFPAAELDFQIGHGNWATQLVPKQIEGLLQIAFPAANRFFKTKSAQLAKISQ